MTTQHPDMAYLVRLARWAGRIMKHHFALGMNRELKSDSTPVTEADLQINQIVCQEIASDFPNIRVIGEEQSCGPVDAEYRVLVDPVDGTIPFSRGIPVATFAIAVIKGNQPLVAAIYDPFMDRLWSAELMKGTFLNGSFVSGVSDHKTLQGANLAILWWKTSPFNIHDVCAKLMGEGVTWGNPLSVAYYGGLLASGECDGIIFPSTCGWETAAMQLIAEEVGGRVTDIFGNPMTYGSNGEIKGHIITNGHIHDKLVEVVRSCQ